MSKLTKVIISASALCVFAVMPAVQAAPQDEGSWSAVVNWPIIPIHTVLTPKGKVMNFGTDKQGLQGASMFFDVWDPKLGTGASSHNTLTNSIGVDSFCSAAILLPETGNILMAGGDNRPNGFINVGINDAPIFNTTNNTLTQAKKMSYARWYPTSTTLPNGNILIVGGNDGQGRSVRTPEVYSPANNTWRSLFGVTTNWGERISFYPRQWVAPNGKIFGYDQNRQMYYMDPSNLGTLQNLGLVSEGDGYRSSAVMYQPGKILKVGGKKNFGDKAAIIDLNPGTPDIKVVNGPNQTGRVWVDSVVLPNGRVMIVGGSAVDNELDSVSYRPEIWDPSTQVWKRMLAGKRARLYHSTAMLLKDGRVLVAGGGAPGPQQNLNAEIFTPPYLYNNSGQLATRPKITSAPAEAKYGASINVSHDPATITRVTLIKTGAVTHSFNMEQRFMDLNFQDTANGVRVTIPNSAVQATPGYYLMHLVNNKGVPSEGHIVRISNTAGGGNTTLLAKDDTFSAVAGTAKTLDPLANDTGSGLTLLKPSSYSKRGGTVKLQNNKLVYTAKQSFTGADNIWYIVKNSAGKSDSGKITINVTGGGGNTGAAPVGVTDNVTARSGQEKTFNVLANDTGSGLVLNAPSKFSQQGGTVKRVNNRIVYKSKAGFTGTDRLWYTFKDSAGRSNFAKVVITVTSGSTSLRPIAKKDIVSTTKGTPITIDIMANDSVGNGGLTIHTLFAYTAKGGRTAKSNGKVRYTPKSTYTGQDNFWYTVIDSKGYKSSNQVLINVTD